MTTTFAKKAVFRMLDNIRDGVLEVICTERTYFFGKADVVDVNGGLRACIAVHDERFFSRVL